MPKLHMTDLVVWQLTACGTYLETPAFGLRINKRRKTWFVIRGRARLRTTVSQYLAVGLAGARYPRLRGAIGLPYAARSSAPPPRRYGRAAFLVLVGNSRVTGAVATISVIPPKATDCCAAAKQRSGPTNDQSAPQQNWRLFDHLVGAAVVANLEHPRFDACGTNFGFARRASAGFG